MRGGRLDLCDNGCMSRSRSTRVIRAWVAASIATFVALFWHVAAGGAMPHWLGIAVPWVLSLAVCTVLVGRALSLLRLSVAVVLSQLLFHLLFVLGAGAVRLLRQPRPGTSTACLRSICRREPRPPRRTCRCGSHTLSLLH